MSARILWQPQLSNYDTQGRFILTADSNWQIFALKAREMVKADPGIRIDVIVPLAENCLEGVHGLLSEHDLLDHVALVRLPIVPSALVTRFDFPWERIKAELGSRLTSYTHVYINDPMLLRHYKALFFLNKAFPKFIVQTHFLDSPVARIAPDEVSYWHGTIEACVKADACLWHCESMEDVFFEALDRDYQPHIVNSIAAKSGVWKDGYSITEIRRPVNVANIRFDLKALEGKTVVWVPNRVGGLGKSFDYTNNGRFLFEVAPEVWKRRQDFVIVAGNPNQKITNDELAERCPPYVKLLPGPVNRDEYRWLSARADVVVGLYTNDTNGGLASLESIEFQAIPLFPNIYEYKVYFDAVGWPSDLRINPDLSDAADVMCKLLDQRSLDHVVSTAAKLRDFVRSYASYEHTTPVMMKRLGFLDA